MADPPAERPAWAPSRSADAAACPPPRRGSRPAPLAPSDALVEEPGRTHRVGVERVAHVDHEVALHGLGDLLPIELQELAPLGQKTDRVSTLERSESGSAVDKLGQAHAR